MGPGNPNNDNFNAKAFKHAISMLESSGGKFLMSKYSSAAGKYHFLWNLIKNDSDLKGVSKREFIGNPDLQERIMDKALSGELKGYPNYLKYANRLKGEYDSDLNVSEIAALTHFLGAGNVRKYLSNPNSFQVTGKNNATAQEYVGKFKNYFNEYVSKNNDVPISNDITIDNLRKKAYEQNVQQKKDAIPGQEIYRLGEQKKQEGLKFIENFKNGGYVNGDGDELTRFDAGGTHEENPIGGIPQGIGSNGKVNLVEEGETKWNDYIFSNSLVVGGKIQPMKSSESNKMEYGGPIDPTKDKASEKSKETSGPIPNPSPEQLVVTKQNHLSNPTVFKDMVVPDVRDKYSEKIYAFKEPIERVNFNQLVRGLGSQAFLDRYNDPITRKRMKEQSGVSDRDIDNMIIKGLSANKNIGGQGRGAKGMYHNDNIYLGEEYANDNNVESHERVHASGIDAVMGKPLTDILGNAFMQNDRSWLKKASPDTLRYLNQPHEAYGNFVEFRSALGLKPGDTIDKAKLKKLVKEKGLDMENFYRAYDPDKIVKALNTIAYQDNNTNSYKIA